MAQIGTSGWIYDDWKGRFYPEEMEASSKLSFYAETFSTVEVNNTFYQLPEAESVEQWRDRTPEGFVFATKMSRYVTHMKNLLEPEEPVSQYMNRIDRLGAKLGPILVQLPPHWNANVDRLRSFIDYLPQDHLYAFEFRDESWYEDDVLTILKENGCAFCIHDHEDAPSPTEITADFVYIRFHGTRGDYTGGYTDEALTEWAEEIAEWERQKLTVYAYFNNDWEAHAVNDAKTLKKLLAAKH